MSVFFGASARKRLAVRRLLSRWGVVRFLSSPVAKLYAVGLLLAVGGCGTFPASGPYSWDIKRGHPLEEGGPEFGLVNLTPETVALLNEFEPKGLAGAFTDQRPPAQIKFGIGDTISVTIFEAAAGGLFIPAEAGVRPGNFVTFPNQTIDNQGNISVPYAGQVKAAGLTAPQVEQEIIERIRNRAIEPQAIVAVTDQRTSLISVLGEVNNPLRFGAAYSGAGDRILDAITRAGGIKGQGFESWVMLERQGRRASVPFENLVMYPQNNIYVQPGDRIYVYREQQKFIAIGAAGQSGEFNFDAWRINLSEAVGKAGGLIDAQADPGAVFLYRAEPRDVAEKLGVNVTKFPGAALIPVIFSVNFREPGGFFLATRVQMRNNDIIYVSNAASVEITKVLQHMQVWIGTINQGLIVPTLIKALP
jgi:polysaccharide biosynthesis/export protein